MALPGGKLQLRFCRALAGVDIHGEEVEFGINYWASGVLRREPWWRRLMIFNRDLNREVDEIVRGERKAFSDVTFSLL